MNPVHNRGRNRWFGSEEVPRWFGLTVVVIFLVGLGAVGYLGIDAVRKEALSRMERASVYALRSLADHLANVEMSVGPTSSTPTEFTRSLSEAALFLPMDWIRIVDERGRVVAASRRVDAGPPSSAGNSATSLLRLPFRPKQLEAPRLGNRDGAESAASPPTPDLLYLEARLDPTTYSIARLVSYAPVMGAVVGVFGVLLFAYRRLRGQLRGTARVAERLASNQGRIEEDLASLRISDTLDGVTASWNQLIDAAQGWHEAVQRVEANSELARVLQHAGTDALCQALNAVPDGIIVITQEVRFEYLNSTACRLLGWRAEQAKQSTLPQATAEGIGKEILDLVRAALRPNGMYEPRSETLDLTDGPGGERGCYRVHILPLPKAQIESACVVLIRDVSQQVRADRAREDFVTQVTHELRTPLTNIRAYAETLASGMFDDPKVISDCYNVITKETRRLSRLIEDILSVSQLEVGTIELHVDNVDLKSLLTDAVRDVRGLADEKNIDVQVALPAKLEPIRADRDKLAVVLNNLLGNAIKYTSNQGNIVAGCQIAHDTVMITVKDNGMGIDPADQSRIFEKFQRGSNPAALAESGTGIGLYTAREIVRRHGGDIEVMSEKGQGSTFMVRLPHRAGRASSVSA